MGHTHIRNLSIASVVYVSVIVTSTDVVPSASAAAPFGPSSSALSALEGAVGLDPAGVPFAPGPASLFVLRILCHLSTSALSRERKENSSSRGIFSDGCRCIWRITFPIFEYCRD